MSRKKLSEFRAKAIITTSLGGTTSATEVLLDKPLADQLAGLAIDHKYVAKVDQAIKGRFKKGLVKLDRSPKQLESDLRELKKLGYKYAIVEPVVKHQASDERYVALERTRAGIKLAYSDKGGVDIENHQDAITRVTSPDSKQLKLAASALGVSQKWLAGLIELFDKNYFAFLEINPLIGGTTPVLLDAAVEVDDVTAPLSQSWNWADIRQYRTRDILPEEIAVEELSAESQASLMLQSINQDGSVFVLLSGGGASVLLADELQNIGHGKELGNYGEYSGNPSLDETTIYTRQVVSLLLKSKSKRKILVIAGGVANFTDVRATFKGIINALKEKQAELQKQQVKVFVRRGGPHQEEGLDMMKKYLEQTGMIGEVAGPEMVLSEIMHRAVSGLGAKHA